MYGFFWNIQNKSAMHIKHSIIGLCSEIIYHKYFTWANQPSVVAIANNEKNACWGGLYVAFFLCLISLY